MLGERWRRLRGQKGGVSGRRGRGGGSEVVSISLRGRVEGDFLSCSVDIVISHTLPSIESNLGPIREEVLCAVGRVNLSPSGPCRGYTSAMNRILNSCRPRNSTSICSTVIHLTRSFSVECVLISNRNGFNSISNSPPTTCHCARTEVDGVSLRVLASVRGGAISFVSGCSSHLGRPAILPDHFPGLLMGNSDNVTINVTARVPPRGLNRAVSTIYALVSGPSTRLTRVVRYVPKPSFPANNVVVNEDNVHTTCTANHKGVAMETGARVVRTGGNECGVVIARLPCGIGGTELVRGVTSLMGSGEVRNVSGVRSRSSHGNVRVRVSVGESTSPRVILGRLFSCARLRAAFNTVVLSVISNRPGVLSLGRVLRYCVRFRTRIVHHHASFSLGGTHSETRVLRNLGVTLSFVSRMVGVVEGDGSATDTGTNLVRHFNLSSVRTRTVIRVHLNRLAGVRRAGVRSRVTTLRTGVRRCLRVLTDRPERLRVMGRRVVRVHGGCTSPEEARVYTIDNRISVRSLVPRRRYILALARFKCMGHLSTSACGVRHEKNHNMSNVSHHRRSVTTRVFIVGSRSCILFFASGNEICHLGYCRIPRKDHRSGNIGVTGLVPVSPSRGMASVVEIPRFSRRGCLIVIAHRNVVGHVRLGTCGASEGNNLVTLRLGRNSRLT